MVESQSSKLITRVRFPSSAPLKFRWFPKLFWHKYFVSASVILYCWFPGYSGCFPKYARNWGLTPHISTQKRESMRAIGDLHTLQVHKRREFSGECSKKPPKQQQMPEKNLRQMFQKTANPATFSGEKTPENVPKIHWNSNIFRRKNSGKCSKKRPIQQHFPEKNLPQMFQKFTETTTFSGEKSPANVPQKR